MKQIVSLMIILTFLIFGCTYKPLKKDIEYFPNDGIYVCTAPNSDIKYKFNSSDSRTQMWLGEKPGIRFFDLEFQRIVTLWQKNNFYTCTLQEE